MTAERLTIAVTGASGFLGSNLVLRLKEEGHQVRAITRETDLAEAEMQLAEAGAVFHLAGVNRPEDESEFVRSNHEYTARVANVLARAGGKPLVIYSSSAKASGECAYGVSKRAGEQALLDLASTGAATVSIWRLPNLFGKWSRPNYNSVVATFCHNAARGLPLRVDNPSAPLSLLHVDDLIDQWLTLLANPSDKSGFAEAQQVYATTVGELANLVQGFAKEQERSLVPDIGSGLSRRLYASYIAALPLADASRPLPAHKDSRGKFVEVLKTAASGQFAYFSAHPGVTRGGHYHHSKVEKFLVAHGTGRFRFREARTGESYELVSSADEPMMIDVIPGWAHDVTNIGDDELVVLTWANEQFDPERPDTHPMPF
jgi:UDP-2-acetamido-2,6-beta-L-arabino-hexul-4-ose reductase